MMKTCARCKKPKQTKYFYHDKNRKDGFKSYCKRCHIESQDPEKVRAVKRNWAKKTYDADPVTAKANQNAYRATRPGAHLNGHLRRKYGITLEEYESMVEAQNGKCLICHFPPLEGDRLVVDHDHKTKKIRGLLCRNCNLVLGHASDNTKILLAAIAYLEAA